MLVECSRCRYVLPADADGKSAPWCPRCGSDVKACSAPRPVVQVAGVVVGTEQRELAQAEEAVAKTRVSNQQEPPRPLADVNRSAKSAALDNPEQVFRASM